MKFFYLSSITSEDGFNYIHERDCPNIPDPMDRDYLGPFNNGDEALRKAVLSNNKAKKCNVCCQKNKNTISIVIKE